MHFLDLEVLLLILHRLVVIPLSFLRRLDSLKYTSVVALISIGYLVILVVYHFAKGDTMADRGVIRVIQWGGLVPTLQSFPVIVFAYTCHQNVSAISTSKDDCTDFSRCSPS
jgi:amino acid permease